MTSGALRWSCRLPRHASRLGRESFRAMLDMTYSLPRVDRIMSRRCPMLVLGAADDGIVRPADVEDTARAHGAPWAIFPMMGHDMMLEQSWEQSRLRNTCSNGSRRSTAEPPHAMMRRPANHARELALQHRR